MKQGHYQDWYKSDDARRHIIDNIGKSGIPLELRTRKTLKDHGFRVTNYRYQDPGDNAQLLSLGYSTGMWRELDIYAYTQRKEILNIGECQIFFTTTILGECKYSSDEDFFVFEHLNSDNVDLTRFPLLPNGDKMLPMTFASHFSLPVLIERVSEINVNSSSRGKGNFTDTITHQACEQLLSALTFNFVRRRSVVRRFYRSMANDSQILRIWKEWLDAGKVEYETIGSHEKVPDGFINSFLMERFDAKTMLQDFPEVMVDVIFPLIVIDESRGIIRVSLDDSYQITGLEDIGMCLYPYISENPDRYETILENSFTVPVFICNLLHLDTAIKIISEGIHNLVERTKEYLESNPHFIAKEIVFNDRIE